MKIFRSLRTGANYNKLLNQILVEPRGKPEMWDGIAILGSVKCKSELQPGTVCSMKLGSLVRYFKTHFVALKIENFLFNIYDGRKFKLYKKWKFMPYAIKELSEEDLEEYADSFKEPLIQPRKYLKSKKKVMPSTGAWNRTEIIAGAMVQNLPSYPPLHVSTQTPVSQENVVEATISPAEPFRKGAPCDSEPDGTTFDQNMYEPSLTLSTDSGRSNPSHLKKNVPSLSESDVETSGHKVYEPSIGSTAVKKKKKDASDGEEIDDAYFCDGSSFTSVISPFEPPESDKSEPIQVSDTTMDTEDQRMQDFDH